MNQIVVIAIIIIGLAIVKFIADKLLSLLGRFLSGIQRSTGIIAVFIAITLVVMTMLYPEKASAYYSSLTHRVEKLFNHTNFNNDPDSEEKEDNGLTF